MNNQEAYEKMYRHLSQMPGRCYDESENSCLMIRDDGNRCVVGSLLTVEEATKLKFSAITEFDSLDDPGYPESLKNINHGLLCRMQNIHDSDAFWDDKDNFIAWYEVRLVGKDFDLKVNFED